MEFTTQQLLYWKTYEKDTSPAGLHNKTIPAINKNDRSDQEIETKIENEIRLTTKEYEDFGDEFKGFNPDAIVKAKAVAKALIKRDGYVGTHVIEAVLFQES